MKIYIGKAVVEATPEEAVNLLKKLGGEKKEVKKVAVKTNGKRRGYRAPHWNERELEVLKDAIAEADRTESGKINFIGVRRILKTRTYAAIHARVAKMRQEAK